MDDLVFLPSPIMLAQPLRVSADMMAVLICDSIIAHKYGDPLADETVRKYRIWVIAEWYRITFDHKYPEHKVAGRKKGVKSLRDQIRLEAEVLKRLFYMLERMHSSNALPIIKSDFYPQNHPLLMWAYLVGERQIAMFNIVSGDPPTATEWKLKQQNLNKYPENMEGLSGIVMSTAVQLADRYDPFRLDYFNPFIDSRKKLVTYIKASTPIVHHHGIPIRQGKARQKQRGVTNSTSSTPR